MGLFSVFFYSTLCECFNILLQNYEMCFDYRMLPQVLLEVFYNTGAMPHITSQKFPILKPISPKGFREGIVHLGTIITIVTYIESLICVRHLIKGSY